MRDAAAGERRPRMVMLLVISVLIVAVDQLTKLIVSARFGPGQATERIELLGTWLAIDYVENRGAAFGILRGQPAVLAVLAMAVLVGVVVYYLRLGSGAADPATAVGLVIGGALGNLADRLRLGYVVDFVAVGPWPTFNVADSAITIGIGLIALQMVAGSAVRGRGDRAAAAVPPAGPNLPANR